jgi:hypothetical protein
MSRMVVSFIGCDYIMGIRKASAGNGSIEGSDEKSE